MEALNYYFHPQCILFPAFVPGVRITINVSSHSSLPALTTEASCHMLISGFALLQRFLRGNVFFSQFPKYMGQCLQTLLVVTTREWGRGAAGI